MWVRSIKFGETVRLIEQELFINGSVIVLIETLILEHLFPHTSTIIMLRDGILWSRPPKEIFQNQQWIRIKAHLAIEPNRIPAQPRNGSLSRHRVKKIKGTVHCYKCTKNYLEDGNRRCARSFGTFPVLRMSSYGKFLTTTILHKPRCPLSSGTFPSEDSFNSVCSSKNITKQTFVLEYSLICNKHITTYSWAAPIIWNGIPCCLL